MKTNEWRKTTAKVAQFVIVLNKSIGIIGFGGPFHSQMPNPTNAMKPKMIRQRTSADSQGAVTPVQNINLAYSLTCYCNGLELTSVLQAEEEHKCPTDNSGGANPVDGLEALPNRCSWSFNIEKEQQNEECYPIYWQVDVEAPTKPLALVSAFETASMQVIHTNAKSHQL